MANNKSFYDSWTNFGAPKKSSNNFNKKLSNGTSIFGPTSTEMRPGNKHGHSGSNFYRSPHSTLGSAAIGRAHTSYGQPGKNNGHKTHRW